MAKYERKKKNYAFPLCCYYYFFFFLLLQTLFVFLNINNSIIKLIFVQFQARWLICNYVRYIFSLEVGLSKMVKGSKKLVSLTAKVALKRNYFSG